MAKTAEQTGSDGPSSRDVGRHLRQVRKQQGMSRGVAARSAGLTRRELAAYERGRTEVPERDLSGLAGSCGVEVSELLPRPEPLRISPELTSLGVGDNSWRLHEPAPLDGLLPEYLMMIYELRNWPPGSRAPFRQPDLAALADTLDSPPTPALPLAAGGTQMQTRPGPQPERSIAHATSHFERASADWQVGGSFPATAVADNGTLALRRADTRWALTGLRAGGDCIIEAAFDFRAGSGFGLIFCGSIDDGEHITGYSFDVDPIAGGGGYLVRLWEGSRQHWRPLAQAPVGDPDMLYGRHVVRLTLAADELTVLVDGDPVLDLPALSRSSVELGHEPCRGDRVGVQAWSTTEVTVESFRVAHL